MRGLISRRLHPAAASLRAAARGDRLPPGLDAKIRGGLMSSSPSGRHLSTAAPSPAAARLPPGLHPAPARGGFPGSHALVDMGASTRLHTLACLSQVSVNGHDSALGTAYHSAVMALNIGSASALPNQFLPVPFAARPLVNLANQVGRENGIDGSGKGGKGSEQKGNASVKDGEGTMGNWDHEDVVSTLRKSCLSGKIPPELQTEVEIDDSGKGDDGSEPGSNGQEIGKSGEGNEGNGQGGGKEADGTASGNGHQGSDGGGGDGGTQGNGQEGRKEADGTGGGDNGHRGKWEGYENFVLYVLTEQRKAQSVEISKLLEENYKLQVNLESFRRDTAKKIHKVEVLVGRTALKILMCILGLLVAAAQFALPFTPAGKALRERLKKVLQEEESE